MKKCKYCSYERPSAARHCPHCGQPSYFPNVEKAEDEQSDLQGRYDSAVADAKVRGVSTIIEEFERRLGSSKAVLNRPFSDFNLLMTEGKVGVYPTFYHLSEVMRLPTGDDEFDSLRRAADGIFFTGYQEEIRFAALSLDSTGLENYGDCSWVLKEDMIAHRTSLFDDNTTLYYINSPAVKGASDVPPGHRAVWADRAKLCIAKLAGEIDNSISSANFQTLLMVQGKTSKDDKIVEAHIFGPLTIYGIEEVTFKPVSTKLSKKLQKAESKKIEGEKEKLRAYGVKVDP
jgi:hypothetical protein